MRRMTGKLCIFIVCLCALVLLLPGCELGTEIDGVWVVSASGVTETVTLSRDHWYDTLSGTMAGSLVASIIRYSGSSRHFQAVVSQVTGPYLAFGGQGARLFVTYDIVGNQLALAASTTGYPPSAGTPVFIKQ